MIFDSIREKIAERFGRQKPMDSEDMSIKHEIESHPAVRIASQQEKEFPFRRQRENPIDIPGQGRGVGLEAGQRSMHETPSLPDEYGLERELRSRMGMPSGAREFRGDKRELVPGSPMPRPSGTERSAGEEMELVIRQLDMIRSQNEMILQRLRMIERKLGLA